MTIPIEVLLFWAALLMFVSVLASKFSERFAIPALLLFLGIGMLAGSEGFGGIYFDDLGLAKSIGIVALIFIIFSGGIDTNWKDIRPVVLPGIVLSTLGVLITALIVAFFAVHILRFSFLEGLLLGSIVSSTDAAAVFNILRSKHIGLKSPLKPMLEFESGSNDPMAVFLTVSVIGLMTLEHVSVVSLIPRFVLEMGGGVLMGYLMARLSLWAIRRLRMDHEGLYPVLTISLVLLAYALAALSRCNGFLAVYVVGLYLGKHEFLNKRLIVRFHDGLAWLMQITMFLTLGLLVYPSHILPVMGASLLLVLILMFVARPLGVFVSLLFYGMTPGKKMMVAWVGLRGAVPIILATFPLLAGIPQADVIFNVVFFVVLTSVLIQGTSIPLVSRWLNVAAPFSYRRHHPIEYERMEGMDAELTDVIIPFNAGAVGRRIADLNTPQKCLILLISRGDKYVIPAGPTVIEGGDVLLVLANQEDLTVFQQALISSAP